MSSPDIESVVEDLKNENLMFVDIIDFIANELKDEIVDEQSLIKAVTCHALSALVPNPSNALLLGSAATGKTTIIINVVSFIPSEYVDVYESLSPQTMRYGANKWFDKELDEDVTDVYVKLQQELDYAEKTEKKEIKTKIKEFEDTYFKCNNLENKLIVILENPGINVLKQFRCFLEHDDWMIMSKSVHEGKQITMNIRGWPALIFCNADGESESADEQVIIQIVSRFNTLRPTTSPDKVEKILNLKADKRVSLVDPSKFEKDLTNKDRVEHTIKFLKDKIGEHKAEYLAAGASRHEIDLTINPFGKDINKMFPMEKQIEARIEKHMAHLMEVITLSRLYKRPYVEVGGLTQYLSVREDYDTIRELIEHFKFSTKHESNETKFIKNVIIPVFFPKSQLDTENEQPILDENNVTETRLRASKTDFIDKMHDWKEGSPGQLEMYINRAKKEKIIESKKGPGGGYLLNYSHSELQRIVNHEYIIPENPERHLDYIDDLIGKINNGDAVLYIDNEPYEFLGKDEINEFLNRYY